MARAAAPAVTASGWILSPLWDSVLFIGAPALCIVTLLPLRALWTSQQLAIALLAFFTFGHHLPGFLRAYGDRELFLRYRWRFLLAPPIVFLTALWMDARQLHGLIIFVYVWDIWHVLMQQYGFMRIYDSKQGSISLFVSRLDRAVAISWYLALILASPPYRHNLLSRAYMTGVPLVTPEVFGAVRGTLLIATAALTLFYVGYHLNEWRLHRPVSLRKLALFAIFLAATYYLYVYVDDFVVGFCVWSAFHCLQYYGIVWAFNRKRVDGNRPVTSLIRFLFRPRASLVLLYVALILAYGGINYLVGSVSGDTWRRALLAFVFTSNALHYYYDGFIWKIREEDTRRYLAIGSNVEGTPAARPAAPGAHGLALAGALALLIGLETWFPHGEVTMQQSLATLAPEVVETHYNLGNALWRQGRLDEAAERYREALRRKPLANAHSNLGAVLYEGGHLDEAIEEYRRALALTDPGARTASASPNTPLIPTAPPPGASDPFILSTNLADALARKGRSQEALEYYQRALRINSRSPQAHASFGATLAELGRYGEGIRELEVALDLDPAFASAHLNLGSIQAYLGQTGPALAHYHSALKSGDERARQAAQAAIRQLRGGQ